MYKTSNGATANGIYGCAKLKTTEAMTRSQDMEPGVIKVIQNTGGKTRETIFNSVRVELIDIFYSNMYRTVACY